MSLTEQDLLGTWTHLGKDRLFFRISSPRGGLLIEGFTLDGATSQPRRAAAFDSKTTELSLAISNNGQAILDVGAESVPYAFSRGATGCVLSPIDGVGVLRKFGQIVEYDIDALNLAKIRQRETMTATGTSPDLYAAASEADGSRVEAAEGVALLLRYNLGQPAAFVDGDGWISWRSGQAPKHIYCHRVDDQTVLIFDNNASSEDHITCNFSLWAAPEAGIGRPRKIDPTLVNKGDK